MRIKPRALRSGDRIAIVGPGSAAPEDKLVKGAESLRGLGFEPVFGKTCFLKRGFMAGPDEVRLADLHWAFSDSSIRESCPCEAGTDRGDFSRSSTWTLWRPTPSPSWGIATSPFSTRFSASGAIS